MSRLARSLTTAKVETRLLGWRLFELGNTGLGRWDGGQDGLARRFPRAQRAST